MGKSVSDAPTSKPYQGVRVKDPVKELLRRKRGNAAKVAPPTARQTGHWENWDFSRWASRETGTRYVGFFDLGVKRTWTITCQMVISSNTLSSYTHAGASSFVEVNQAGFNDSVVDVSGLYTGWLAQPTSTAAVQPLGHWSSPDCQHHDPSSTTDMYVQPICPSYTVVGPSSMLTFTHTPLFTNLGTMSTFNSTLPQEVPDSSLTYIPWAQPLSTISSPVMQAPSIQPTLSATQLFPLPLTLPVVSSELEPQHMEPPQATEGTLALEKLLEEEDEGHKDTYICNPSLFSEDI